MFFVFQFNLRIYDVHIIILKANNICIELFSCLLYEGFLLSLQQ